MDCRKISTEPTLLRMRGLSSVCARFSVAISSRPMPENGGHSVVVLNYRFWQRHFGGDPHVIGRTLEMDHAPYTIVGVMPRSFAFNDIAGVGDVYLPG